MVRSASAATAWAKNHSRGYGGLCLAYTRQALGVAAKYASAKSAWDHATKRHKTNSTAQIPVGVPIFFSKPGHPYGHVGLYAGGGKFWSTHASTNRTGLDRVSLWTQRYGYKLLGWAEDLNGVTVYKPKPASSSKTSRYRVTAKAGVNVRSKPSTSARVVRKLPKGSTFTVRKGSGTVRGSGHRWYKSTAGHFVAAEYVKKVS